VVRYAGVDVAGADGTLTVDVRRPGACAGRRTCLFTGDRRLVNRSDAVVFSDTTPPHEFPAYRTPRQKWILRTMEVDSVPDRRREGPLWGTKVRRYNRGSAGSLGWPFPMLKYKYIFRKNTRKQFYQTTLGKLLWFEITEMLTTVKNKFTVLFIIIFGSLSFPVLKVLCR